MKLKANPIVRQKHIVVQELNGEVLIYDLKTNKAFCLNETSALVWQLCNGTNSFSEISQAISKKLNSPGNEDLVWLALDQLKRNKLIENNVEITSHFDGMSRREIIRKVGLGTMIALPFISSLVAPTSIMAQSSCAAPTGRPAGCPCSPNGANLQCASGVCNSGACMA